MGVGTLPVYSLDYREKNPETVLLSQVKFRLQFYAELFVRLRGNIITIYLKNKQ